MPKYHVADNYTAERCRTRGRRCARGGAEWHYRTIEEAEVAALEDLEMEMATGGAQGKARGRIVAARFALIESGESQATLGERDRLADRVPVCFKRLCYADSLADLIKDMAASDDPMHFAYLYVKEVAATGPRSLRPFWNAEHVARDWSDELFDSRAAFGTLVEEALGDWPLQRVPFSEIQDRIARTLEAMADPNFDLTADWAASEERSFFARWAPQVLAQLEDEVDEATVYRMLRAA